MNRIFDNKLAMAFVALLLSLTMFVFVKAERYNDNPVSFFQNISENTTETISNVPVHVKGNMSNYYITGLPDTVSVELSGPSNLIKQTLDAQSFKVTTEDLTLLGIGKHYVKLNIDNLPKELSYKISPSSVNITISQLETKAYHVDYHLNDQNMLPNYAVSQISIDPDTVTLGASAEKLAQVSQVYVNIEVPKDATESYATKATVIITDVNGEILDISSDPQQVDVQVSIQSNSNTVPIAVTPINGSPDLQYDVELLTTHNVTLSGNQQLINQIDQVKGYADVQGINGPTDLVVSLEKPAGITSMTPQEIKVRITPQSKGSQTQTTPSTEVNKPASEANTSSRQSTSTPQSKPPQ